MRWARRGKGKEVRRSSKGIGQKEEEVHLEGFQRRGNEAEE
jgi:hypothetical protein